MEKKGGNGGFALLCSFIALGVAAIIAFITYLLPLIGAGISIGDNVMNVLDLIFKAAALIGLSFGAFAFAARRGGFVKFLTALFVLVFILAIIFVIIDIV